MIRLTRDRTRVHGGFRGNHLRNKLLLVFQKRRESLIDRTDKIKFTSYWKNTKPQLVIEANSKCAYCEASTKTVAHGDVEHYRPKSIYWWLAYTYDNYLFSCQICNQIYKGANFPLEGIQIPDPVVVADMDDLDLVNLIEEFVVDPRNNNVNTSIIGLERLKNDEAPLILNPYIDSPEKWFAYDFDDTLEIVEIVPFASNDQSKKFVDAAIEYLGLNREELLEQRYNVFKKFRTFRRTLSALENNPELFTETKTMIQDMQEPKSVFSGMCQYFAKLPLNQLRNTNLF